MPQPQAPLVSEPSATTTHHQVTETLPDEVVQCLQNARFLHLATCTDRFPHVALMNYTYVPSSPYSSSPTIIMTTNPSSKKTHNLVSNPNVSLLVHDWVSHRPPTTNARRMSTDRTGSPPPEVRNSSLATLLANLNTSALSSISATINGEARLVDQGTDEEKFFREIHLENNTFGDGEDGGNRWDALGNAAPDGGRGTFIEGEEVRVVVVKIRDARVSDWKGAVRDWSLSEGGESNSVQHGALVNGAT